MRQVRLEPRSISKELDDVTLARAQRGDHEALRQLVERYEPLVWSYLWRMLRPGATHAIVEDLFQDTFLGVHLGLPRYSAEGPARLSTWILAIATHVALNHLRQRRPERSFDARVDDRGDDGAGVAGIEGQTLGAQLSRAIAALNPDHRAVFVLREFHGFDYDEIARVLAVEVGTVCSRLNRAREALRRSLEEGRHE